MAYDVESIGHADEDLMRLVYNTPPFPFLESLQSFDRVMTFKEILFCSVDEDEDY